MKPPIREMQPLDVRRAVVADADQVRYRVYSSPIECVAVIADSALMAVKVSGIKAPYKIMRDFPTDGVAIAAKRMAEITVPQTVTLPIVKVVDKTDIKAELAPSNPSVQERFVPMDLVALQHPHGPRSRILPPDMLYDIIETHVREAMAAPAKAAEPSVAAELNAELNAEMTPEPAPAPQQSVAEAGVNAAGDADVDVAILSAPTSIPHAQMITQMAAEILPPTEPAPAPVTPAPEVESLSPVDVEKLLHDS